MSDIPSDYAHKRGVWHMSMPSSVIRMIDSDAAYQVAMARWKMAEPYADIAKRIEQERADVTPKPATAEPPEWKELDTWGSPLLQIGETFTLDGRQFTIIEAVQTAPGTPEEIIDRVTDALSPDPIAEFNARRIAKREVSAEDREAYLDRLVREAIEGQRATERKGAPLARAMSIDLHHTISDLIRPWRGK